MLGLGGAFFLCACCCLSPFLGVPAVVLAHSARGAVRRSGGVEGGAELATAGEVLGWISIATPVLFAAFGVLVLLLGSGGSNSGPILHRPECLGC
jgi:hypothetical protein